MHRKAAFYEIPGSCGHRGASCTQTTAEDGVVQNDSPRPASRRIRIEAEQRGIFEHSETSEKWIQARPAERTRSRHSRWSDKSFIEVHWNGLSPAKSNQSHQHQNLMESLESTKKQTSLHTTQRGVERENLITVFHFGLENTLRTCKEWNCRKKRDGCVRRAPCSLMNTCCSGFKSPPRLRLHRGRCALT